MTSGRGPASGNSEPRPSFALIFQRLDAAKFSPSDNTGRIVAALIVGGLGLLGTILWLMHGNVRDPGSRPSSGGQPGASAGQTGRVPAVERGHTEYADWRGGVAVYSSDRGSASDLPPIPFNRRVRVACVAPNESAMSSINAFYLIGSGRWKGVYASASEFSNGGQRGLASDPSIDPAGPACRR